MEVVPLDSRLEPAYRELLARDGRALVYHSPEFRSFLARAAGGDARYLAALDDGRLAGVLPLFERTDPALGRVLNSLPWWGSHGGCVVDPDAGEDARAALLAALRAEATAEDVLSATVILTPFENTHVPAYRAALEPRATDDRIGQLTSLPAAEGDVEAALLTTVRQKTRNLVRKALRQGFVEQLGDEPWMWDFLAATHAANLAAMAGQAKPRAHFDALRDALPAGWRRLSVALLDGEPVAALLLLRYAGTVEYLTPVVLQEHRPRQPLSFLIWHAMLDSAAAGYSWWNWGGTWSSQDSLHHFKAGWGAQDLPYTYLVLAHDDGLARLRAERERAVAAFPFYYLYPFALLDDAG